MSSDVLIRHEHRLGPGWHQHTEIEEIVALPEPLDEIKWKLCGNARNGQLSLELIKPAVLPRDIAISTSFVAGDKVERRDQHTFHYGQTELELGELEEYRQLSEYYQQRENCAFFAIRFNYPLSIFSTLTANITRYRKLINASSNPDPLPNGEQKQAPLFPSLEEWYPNSTRSNPVRNCDEVFDEFDIQVNYSMNLSDLLNSKNANAKLQDSELFRLHTFSENQFQLRFYPETKFASGLNKFGLSIRTDKSFETPLTVDFGFERTDNGVKFRDSVTLEPGKSEVRTSNLHLRSSDLFKTISSRQRLEVEAFVTITLPRSFIEKFCTYYEDCKIQAENVIKNNNDEIVIKVGPSEIKAHRGVLASASPYFSSMLMSSFLEASSGEINFSEEDFRPEVMQLIVNYINTDQIDEDQLAAHDADIYQAASYLLMDKLKRLAIESITSSLTPAKALQTMMLAHIHSDTNSDLKSICMDYVIKHLYTCQKLAMWKPFFINNYELANELLTKTRKLVKYKDIREAIDTKKDVRRENQQSSIKIERSTRNIQRQSAPLMQALSKSCMPRKKRKSVEVVNLSD